MISRSQIHMRHDNIRTPIAPSSAITGSTTDIMNIAVAHYEERHIVELRLSVGYVVQYPEADLQPEIPKYLEQRAKSEIMNMLYGKIIRDLRSALHCSTFTMDILTEVAQVLRNIENEIKV